MLLLSKNDYSQFFLNGHLYKTGISLGLTPAWCWSLSFFSHFNSAVTILSIRWSPL